jgi:uncharacterized phage protein (TIGR02216 family)
LKPFPWDAAMRLAFGVLHMSPADFWRLSPRELAAIARATGPHRPGPAGRDWLDKLMTRFPDGG